jgi:hypothetical protein
VDWQQATLADGEICPCQPFQSMLTTPTHRTNLPGAITGDTNANQIAALLLQKVVAIERSEHKKKKRNKARHRRNQQREHTSLGLCGEHARRAEQQQLLRGLPWVRSL